MSPFGEEETIQELIESEGVTGQLEKRLRKRFQDWIRANVMTIQHSVYGDHPKCREAIQKVADRLLCDTPTHTWKGPGPGSAA